MDFSHTQQTIRDEQEHGQEPAASAPDIQDKCRLRTGSSAGVQCRTICNTMTGSKGQLLWGVCIAMPWFGVIALTVPAHQPGLRMRRMAKRTALPNDKCANDSECPLDAVCQSNTCYCDGGLCNSRYLPACFTLVKRDDTCTEMITTTEGPTQRTSPPVTGPQTPRPENRRCQLQFNKELQECENSMNQDGFCNLLRQNARIQETSCHRNDTNVTAQQVANEFSEILNHTTLNNLTTSELRSAFTSIVETVETSLLETFSNSPQNQNISTPEMEVQMKVSRDICGRDSSLTLTVLENTMQVPCAHVSGSKDGAILISYIGLESKLNGSAFGALGEDNPEDSEKINSPIISGAITSPNTANLEPPVAFHLRQLTDVPPSFILQCVFWDLELKIWSSRGCETQKSDRVNSSFCVCNHLSTFAVLMAPSYNVDYGLVLISRIGLSVSLVCLCLSLLTFLLCRSIRSAHTSVLTALCVCLFIGQLLALFGLHQTGYKVLCGVIAGLLQFSFLCAFCWMSLESALLFMTVRNLQAMNYLTSQRSLFPYMCIAGFGIPLIIIIVSAAMRPDGYGTEKYCWLRQDLVWSFIGPVCVFITINFILLVTTFVLLKKKIASLNANVSTLKQTRLLTFKALSQLFILGCTWIIGIFQFGSGSLVMSYIFTICNSLQGLYIFCVHCLLNRQVMEEYRRGFRRLRSRRSDSEVTSGTTLPMTKKSPIPGAKPPSYELHPIHQSSQPFLLLRPDNEPLQGYWLHLSGGVRANVPGRPKLHD
ncbi:PREDICTED: adhesion G protein-coupled receptor E3-like [Nanorana parkeri]|uniref:adhesion G protein-coupled receptor E3-like n=1 Tax=Nanorana parkeri TaxID=125878 RepID=UPI000855062A|nr:PREDICTED: adhesion G protein-coupled receptor E3-like [Nanorana parkeri]